MKTKEGIEVSVGQIWQDLDKRMRDRKRKIVAVLGERVIMDEPEADFVNSRHPTKVSVSRMHRHSTGWKLCSSAQNSEKSNG